MPRPTLADPADLSLMVTFLRALRRWTQAELSRASGVDRGLISDYELGSKSPTRKTLQRLAAAVGLPYSHVELLLPIFRESRLAAEGSGGASAAGPSERDLTAGVDPAILTAVRPRLARHLMELERLRSSRPAEKAS